MAKFSVNEFYVIFTSLRQIYCQGIVNLSQQCKLIRMIIKQICLKVVFTWLQWHAFIMK